VTPHKMIAEYGYAVGLSCMSISGFFHSVSSDPEWFLFKHSS